MPEGFSKYLFWDINPDELNMDTCPSQIISRVLECGEMSDWRIIRDYYGIDKITEVCQSMRTLDPRALSYICLISNTKKEDYRCYRTKQSSSILWNS